MYLLLEDFMTFHIIDILNYIDKGFRFQELKTIFNI